MVFLGSSTFFYVGLKLYIISGLLMSGDRTGGSIFEDVLFSIRFPLPP